MREKIHFRHAKDEALFKKGEMFYFAIISGNNPVFQGFLTARRKIDLEDKLSRLREIEKFKNAKIYGIPIKENGGGVYDT